MKIALNEIYSLENPSHMMYLVYEADSDGNNPTQPLSDLTESGTLCDESKDLDIIGLDIIGWALAKDFSPSYDGNYRYGYIDVVPGEDQPLKVNDMTVYLAYEPDSEGNVYCQPITDLVECGTLMDEKISDEMLEIEGWFIA